MVIFALSASLQAISLENSNSTLEPSTGKSAAGDLRLITALISVSVPVPVLVPVSVSVSVAVFVSVSVFEAEPVRSKPRKVE